MPSRRTALHRRHVELGAKMADLDGWILPRFFRGVEDEFKDVLRSVGICDISHYGKVDVKGSEIDKFMEKNLSSAAIPRKAGEVKLSSRASERDVTGKRLSLIYACRLTKEHALLLTQPFNSTSVIGVEGVLKSEDGANLTNVSSTLAGLTVAGPSSEAVLRKLVQVDLGRETGGPFSSEAGLAKVHSTIVRFDGKSSAGTIAFDVFCGRDYAEYVWDAIIEAGHEYGIAPFGLDAHDRLGGSRSSG
jgi:glycine cleavage system aminomethyltransferase T